MEEGPAIEARGLIKRYGKVEAVRGIDLVVPRNSIFTVVGPNGAGKTTTIEMLETIRQPTEGTIRILGMDPYHDAVRLRERIGVLPQSFYSFFRLTVTETLAYYAGLYRDALPVDEVVRLMGLEEHRDKRFFRLSGGLQRRVGIGAALVNDPDLVFLDEPTAGLDPVARRQLWDVLRDLVARGKTVFLTTHYMDEAEVLSDNVALVSAGRIVAEGHPSTLIATHGGSRTLVVPAASPEILLAARSVKPEATLGPRGDLVVPLARDDAVQPLLEAFAAAGVPTREVHLRRPSLDDVFLRLVSDGTRPGERAEAAASRPEVVA